MRTYHNQSSKTSNNKERTTLNTTHIHSKDKSQKNKELYTDEVNSRKEITNLYSSEQSCLSRALSQIQLQSQSSLTTPLMSTISSCSTNQLICSLCSEQFKEKHHLTRHMLSHT
ncbi:unnamed protein product [Heterobilharzia americana]|nr:unnamed protein product [Heterobilharzia americana]